MPELLVNIHHVKAHHSEDLLNDGFDYYNSKSVQSVHQLVAQTALDSMHQYPGRFGGLNAFDRFSSEGGVTIAKKEIERASKVPINRYDVDETTVFDSKSWMGAVKKTVSISDLVMVRRGETLTDSLGNVIIRNGIRVEACTTGNLEDLTEDYREGYAIAEKMRQTEDEIIFAVETAQSMDEKKSRIARWLSNELTVDPVVHNYIGLIFANRTDPVLLNRSDINIVKRTTPAHIFTNQPLH